MKKIILVLATLIAGASLSAQTPVAAPAAPSYSVTVDFPYVSKYVFRGVELSKGTFQPSVKLTLPETGDTPKPGAADEKPPIIVTVADGEPHYFVGNRAVTSDKLQTELKLAASADPETRLIIRADGGAEWRLVVKVMELAKLAPMRKVTELAIN